MKCQKIGLVLGGGGSKGAYQLGALLALSKHNLLSRVKVISAVSIGSINLLLLLSDNLESGIKVWNNLAKEDMLSKKKIRSIIAGFRNFGLYSRSGLLTLLDQNIDFDKVSTSPIISYVTAAKVLKKDYQATYFKLNGESKENIVRYVLASSAIPLVYEPILIDGVKYVDGGKIENEPFTPLLDHDLDLTILIPLNTRYVITENVLNKTPIINLHSQIFHNLKSTEGIKLDSDTIKMRLETGFTNTDQLITSLRKQSIIAITFKEKFIRFIKKLFRKLPKEKQLYQSEE